MCYKVLQYHDYRSFVIEQKENDGFLRLQQLSVQHFPSTAYLLYVMMEDTNNWYDQRCPSRA